MIAAVDHPVNVVTDPRLPGVTDLAHAGVSRISTGTALAFSSLAALVQAASEFREAGTYGFVTEARAAAKSIYPVLRG